MRRAGGNFNLPAQAKTLPLLAPDLTTNR